MTFCTECGARYAADEVFCTECGATRHRPEPVAPGPSADPSRLPADGKRKSGGGSRRTLIWTAATFVVALALVVGVGRAITVGDEGTSGSDSVASPSPSASRSIEATGSSASSPAPAPSTVEEPLPAFPSPGATAQLVSPQPGPTTSPTPVPAFQSEPGVQEALDLSEEQAARMLLADEAAALNSLSPGRWYPFLSSKCAGMGAYDPLSEPLDMGPAGRIGMPDGVGEDYSYLGSQRILALQRYYQWRFGPQVVNVTTQGLGRETTYESLCGPSPMWITLNAGVSFSKAGDALTWCRENGFITGECGAFPAFMPKESIKRI